MKGYVVVVALKINATGNTPEEARAQAIDFLNEQMEDVEPFASWVPAWQTLNVKEERTDDPLDCDGDERVWFRSDYERNEFAGHIDVDA